MNSMNSFGWSFCKVPAKDDNVAGIIHRRGTINNPTHKDMKLIILQELLTVHDDVVQHHRWCIKFLIKAKSSTEAKSSRENAERKR